MAENTILEKYYNNGYLSKKYYINGEYKLVYSAEDRLKCGILFYNDFIIYNTKLLPYRKLNMIKVDNSNKKKDFYSISAKRLYLVKKYLDKSYLNLLIEIIINQKDIIAPKELNTRERLYFSNDIKLQFCRSLDKLCKIYIKNTQ